MRIKRTVTESDRERFTKEFETKFGFTIDNIVGKCFEIDEEVPDIYFKVKELRDDLIVIGMQIDKENLWVSYELIELERFTSNFTLITYPYLKRVLDSVLIDLGEIDPLKRICELIVELKTKEIPQEYMRSLRIIEDGLAMILYKIKREE